MNEVAAAPARIHILLAIAVRLYRDGLAMALGAHERLQVQATAGPPDEMLRVACARPPHLVVVDVCMPGGVALIRALRCALPDLRILAFAVGEEIDAILDYVEAGADGFFNADGSLPELLECIERTVDGELLCSPRVTAQLLQQATHREARPAPPGADGDLTGRERQVFELLQQGRSNKEIAAHLHIAEATVKNHVHHVLGKLRVATRGKAVAAHRTSPRT